MGKRRSGWVMVIAFVLTFLFGTILGSIIQTQFNLLALQNLGVDIAMATRLETTLHDVINFGPLYAVLFGLSFAASQALALLIGRYSGPRWQPWLCGLGAAVGLWVTLKIVDALAPMPTLIAATRGVGGMLAMLAGAGLAGWLFYRVAYYTSSASGSSRSTPVMVLVLASGLVLSPGEVDAQQSRYQVQVWSEGLEHPWSIAFLPDGGALVTERSGHLRRLAADGELQPDPVAGVPPVYASGQAGLYEVLLAPDFNDSRRLYLAYACGSPEANHTCLARGRLANNRLENVEEIFRAQPAKVGSAHFGGRLVWLPDGTLVLALGDGFDYREEAQRLSSHIGTTVRLTPDGSVPGDNPFIGDPDVRDEIYSYGHRNIQGMVYDSEQGQLVSHEHGPRGGDEINIIRPGNNYGWPVATYGLDYTWAKVSPYTEYEGTEQPLLQWTPSIAPSGMALYRGELFPQWQGSLLVGALASRQVHRVTLKNGSAQEEDILFEELDKRIRDVETGPDGAVYLLTDHKEGQVLRVIPQ